MSWKLRSVYAFLMAGALCAAFDAGYRVRARDASNQGWFGPQPAAPSFEKVSFLRTADADGKVDPSSAGHFKPDLRPYETLDEVRRDIKENFYKTDIDDTNLTYGAIRGMLHSLGDRFTRFMTPEEYDEFEVKNEGEFTGIGARIDLRDEYIGSPDSKPYNSSRPYIVEPIAGGPAAKAGLLRDDVILEIDGRNTADMSEDATVAYIRGVRGTPVKLKIERKLSPNAEPADSRPGSYKVFDVTLNRDIIEMHPVSLQWLDGNIAWLRLNEFNKKSDPEMTAALQEIEKGPPGKGRARGIILDMRDNPGGLLDAAVDIGSRFVPSGPIVITRERNGQERPMKAETDRFLNLKLPMVVLINRYSASAAEVVTGALKDNNVATVVGEQSFGKASVQVLIELKNGGALVITTAKYLTPGKHDITEKGIAPDVVVKASDDDEIMRGGRGAQLMKAIEVIKAHSAAGATMAVRPG